MLATLVKTLHSRLFKVFIIVPGATDQEQLGDMMERFHGFLSLFKSDEIRNRYYVQLRNAQKKIRAPSDHRTQDLPEFGRTL